MSKADEMFKELGYEITEVNKSKNKYDNGIQYTQEKKDLKTCIEFYFYHRQIMIFTEQKIRDKIVRWDSVIVGMQELQAINEKCKELGWL